MKRRLQRLGMAVLVLALAVFGAFAAWQLGQKKMALAGQSMGKEKGKENISLFSGASAVTSIQITRAGERYVILREGEEYCVEGYEGLPRNETAYESIQTLSGLRAQTDLGADPKRYGEYGVAESGNAQVTLFFENGSHYRLVVGEENLKGSRYLLGEDGHVYLTDNLGIKTTLQPPMHYLSPNVAPYSADPSVISLQSMDYIASGGESFSVARTDIDNSTHFSTGYSIIHPIQREIRYGMITPLTTTAKVLQGSILAVYPKEEELLSYGLQSPAAKMTVYYQEDGSFLTSLPEGQEASAQNGEREPADQTKKGVYTILVGQVGENWYAMREGVPIIYQVEAEVIPWKDFTVPELMSRYFFDVTVDQIGEIHLVGDGVQLSLEAFSGENRDNIGAVLPDGTPVDSLSLGRFYELLTEGEGTEWMERGEMKKEPPLFSLTIAYRNGGSAERQIQFFSYSEGQVRVHTNDPQVQIDFLVPRRYVNKLVECAQIVESNGRISSIIW